METKTYTIEQLAELTGYSRRTIRYYIQQGLLEPPAGRGRGGFYFDSHLQKLHEIRERQEKGLRLAAIQELGRTDAEPVLPPERDVWIRYTVIPGIEFHIQRNLEESHGRRIMEIIRIIKSLLKGEQNE